MKKTIIAIAGIVVLQGSAYAGTGVPGGQFTFRQSNNVSIYYDTSGTGGTPTAQDYVVNSVHFSGNRIYSTTNATSNIWYKTIAVGSSASAAGVTVGQSTYDVATWTSQ
ncbi:MAG: hypothetical protein WCP20_10400 [Desulfuromonadales bacterium]